jgi:hypothetical protein
MFPLSTHSDRVPTSREVGLRPARDDRLSRRGFTLVHGPEHWEPLFNSHKFGGKARDIGHGYSAVWRNVSISSRGSRSTIPLRKQ